MECPPNCGEKQCGQNALVASVERVADGGGYGGCLIITQVSINLCSSCLAMAQAEMGTGVSPLQPGMEYDIVILPDL